MYNKITTNDYGFGNKQIEGVTLKLTKSTSQAKAFHLGMKVACLDWCDPIIPFLQNLIDNRLLEVAEANEKGVYQKVNYKKLGSDRQYKKTFDCLTKERAIELMKMYEPKAEVISVEEIKVENRHHDDAKESIISNPF